MKKGRCARIMFAILAGLCSLSISLAHAAPENGWWWNPAESGRGFFLEVQGPNMFLSGYFYGEDGRATWLVSNDPMPNANSYDGRLLAFADGQGLVGAYRHPRTAVDTGSIALRFTDERHGTLTWAGKTVAIERYAFQHGAAATFQPKTGWWWNPNESGRGFSIEMQGDHMFIAAYLYDASGNPIWYVADAFMASPRVFRGPLLQFAGGQTMSGAYRAPGAAVTVGTILVEFSATNRATITLSDDRPASGMFSKTSAVFSVLPQFETVVLPGTMAKAWVGGIDERVVATQGPVVTEFTREVTVMTWTPSNELASLNGATVYTIASSLVILGVHQTSPGCTADGAISAALTDGLLTVDPAGRYKGYVKIQKAIPIRAACEGGSVEGDIPGGLDFTFSGSLEGGLMVGHNPDPGFANQVITGSWSFSPRF